MTNMMNTNYFRKTMEGASSLRQPLDLGRDTRGGPLARRKESRWCDTSGEDARKII